MSASGMVQKQIRIHASKLICLTVIDRFTKCGQLYTLLRSRIPTVSYTCKLLVVGGGTGGCNVAWRFSRRLKDIVVLEPSDVHYYQPGFTLVAAGIRQMKQIQRPMESVLPPNITWIQDRAEGFDPAQNAVYTSCGCKIVYEYMIIAIGLQNDYSKIIGLKQALDNPNSTVSTIYSKDYCTKTWSNVKKYKGGHAVFTYPASGGKCSGAVMKIMFLAHDYWRRHNIRGKTSITFNTANESVFIVKKYATALTNLSLDRDIVINYCTNLVEVRPSGALFQCANGQVLCFPYNMLHVTPPMSAPACLSTCESLVNKAGFLSVNMHTLQHTTFYNIFGLGDCIGTENSKTAAAIGPQSYVVEQNLRKFMAGKTLKATYNGYGACPLLTSYKRGILAEYLYDKKIHQTFPIDQCKENRLFYRMQVNMMPAIYWRYMIKGKFNGPGNIARLLNPCRR